MINSIPNLPKSSWYAVANISDITDRLYKVVLFKQAIVISKSNDGSIKAFYDYCPHRGYPLSEGTVKNNEIVCAYHGWCFDKSGECKEVPGLEKTPKFKLKKLNIALHDGLVWITLEADSIFDIKYKKNDLNNKINFKYKLNAPSYLLIENTLDPLHTPYIHAGLVRSETKLKKEIEISIKNNSTMVEAIYKNEGKQSGLISKIFSPPNVDGIGRYIHPGILELEFKSPTKTYLIFSAYLAPISDEKVNVILDINYSKLPVRVDILLLPIFKYFIKKVIQQDIDVCEKQFESIKMINDFSYLSTKADYMIPYINAFFAGKAKPDEEKTIKILI